MVCPRNKRQGFRLRTTRYEILEHRERTDMILIAGHEQFCLRTGVQRGHIAACHLLVHTLAPYHTHTPFYLIHTRTHRDNATALERAQNVSCTPWQPHVQCPTAWARQPVACV